MLESVTAYQMLTSAFVKKLLRCYQMFTCGIPYQMLVSVATYHIFTYDIAYNC